MIEYKLQNTNIGPNTFDLSLQTLRIVFMGTPEFAVASLRALLAAGYNVVGVITAPDKPAGRGMKLTESAVKRFAVEKGLQVLQPEKLKNPEFLEQLRELRADLQVVVAFRMLPEIVWNMPRLGSVNLHGSLLPQYRGAAPINWAVINGEPVTGVTTFRLKQEIDTGGILLQERFPVGGNETAGEVHDRMMEIGAQVLVRTVKGLNEGSLQPVAQPELHSGDLHHAPKIFTETCRIDFTKSSTEVHNLIRGLSPFPGAFTLFQGKMLKIFRSENLVSRTDLPTGEYRIVDGGLLLFGCRDGCVSVRELQLEGKKRMTVEEFLRGMRI